MLKVIDNVKLYFIAETMLSFKKFAEFYTKIEDIIKPKTIEMDCYNERDVILDIDDSIMITITELANNATKFIVKYIVEQETINKVKQVIQTLRQIVRQLKLIKVEVTITKIV